ncbi:T9SS type A sorting domain-containing protein [Hyunsoonleella aestuarii]|uniref:T9SS sorting signal type C domain-containing protein n=1 Tax=Hyunsoonleella aestuarii TaxID=912802 RepID=A0ABP8E8X1_9FLAO|nr:T9SS type A sorting domain-containing protein [Hyunsoonleella aestuarii]
MKNFFLIGLVIILSNYCYSQTTLSAGDIAILGVNTDNEDFTFVLRANITAGTQIYFSDNEVNVSGTGLLDTNEGIILFTASIDYSCGAVLGLINNAAEFSNFFGNFQLNNNGDEVIAFQGYSAPNWGTFLHANVSSTINLPAGFTANDILIGTRQNREYIGNTNNPSWSDLNSLINYTEGNNYSGITLSTTSHTCFCSTTAMWNGAAWDNVIGPNINMTAVIDGNYNTSIFGSFSACSLVINSGNRLTVDNSTYVIVDKDAVIDGELIVETQGNFVQNDASAEFILNPSGIARVNKQTATKEKWYYYTYWSSPVESETINSVFPNTSSDRRFYFDAFSYLDEDGDNIDDNGDDWTIANGLMIPGVGYAATSSPLGIYPSTDIATFNGVFNTGDIQVTVANNPNNVNESWNLIGNPYSSAISFTDLYNANSTVIDGVAYLWSQASIPEEANPGNEKLNFSQNDYATYTVGSGGIAGGGPDIPNGYIPSGQSFFVAGLVNNGLVTFTNGIRKTDTGSNSQFFKSVSSKTNSSLSDNKIWFNLTSDNGVFSQILVAYVEGATMQNDGLMFDAPRLITANKGANLFSTIKRSNKKFAIQGRSPKNLNQGEKIKLGLQTFIETPTIYKFSIVKTQGDFLNNSTIFLRDKYLNKLHELSQYDYSFTSDAGEFKDRFEIVFKDTEFRNLATVEKTEVHIIEDQANKFTFSSTNDLVLDEISIFDFSGNLVYKLEGNSSQETFELSKLKKSLYIAKVELSSGDIITKKFIKNN